MGILLTFAASFTGVIIAIVQMWQLTQRNRVTLPIHKVRMCWSWNCNPGSSLYKAQISEELRGDACGSRLRCRVSQSLRSAFTSLGRRVDWGSHSHYTDGESKPRSKRFSHVGFNILKVMGTSWVTENQILSRKIDGGWRSTPLLAVGDLGFLLVYLLVPFLFIAHSAGEMFFGPCLSEFCIFSLFTPDPASLELGFSWKDCL